MRRLPQHGTKRLRIDAEAIRPVSAILRLRLSTAPRNSATTTADSHAVIVIVIVDVIVIVIDPV
jgi:hypothetical protein